MATYPSWHNEKILKNLLRATTQNRDFRIINLPRISLIPEAIKEERIYSKQLTLAKLQTATYLVGLAQYYLIYDNPSRCRNKFVIRKSSYSNSRPFFLRHFSSYRLTLTLKN